jgi:hypothetical protein
MICRGGKRLPGRARDQTIKTYFMPNLITAKIDVRRLDKARFFEGKPDANGHKPLYADVVLIPRREPGKFGDTHLVKQSKKKDEVVRDCRSSAARPSASRTANSAPAQPAPKATQTIAPDDGEDVPF